MLARTGKTIKIGDEVIAYVGYNDLRPIKIHPGKELQCSLGRFFHNDMIGKQLGTRVGGKPPRKTDTHIPEILLLPCTPELWTKAVLHRTQIIYATDIAMITTCLRLVPGSTIAEAGTGSGSLTHSLARAVAPHGTVHTFDFHKGRALDARNEFKAHGIDHVITSHWADVCNTGVDVRAANGEESVVVPDDLGKTDIADMTEPQVGYCLPKDSVQAVFLDVPAPWAAVENVMHVLCPAGMLCSFSPCIEQTQRLCEALRETDNFVDVRTVEVLAHDYVPVFQTEGGATGSLEFKKRKRDDSDVGEGPKGAEGEEADEKKEDVAEPGKVAKSSRKPLHFRPVHMMKSHTAFLTFARRKLRPIDESGDATPAEGEESKKE